MSDRWQQIEQLYHSALERDGNQRAAFLREACAGDDVLREEVESLLAQEKGAESFLEAPALDAAAKMLGEDGGQPVVGRQIGSYQVLSLLGAGGMGEVYQAHDTSLRRDVAIKVLPAGFVHDAEQLSRFQREARMLAALNHPNIATIHGLEQSGGMHYLVMELVEGDSLRGPLPIAQVLDYARQVAEALEAAHAKGIIHRDLKPANVKVTPQGRVKVLDFGLAKAIWAAEGDKDLSQRATATGIETLAGHIVGTPGYMSPEQARGREVDKRTDIWAFGCLLYELLTGKRTFKGETQSDTIAAVLEREPDWQALPAKTPAKIRQMLRECLQKDANRRLNNIADAHRTIEKVQAGGHRWRVAAITVAALASLAIGTALLLRRSTHLADRSQWVQLTKFADAVSQPALSPDGRMLAFIRGSSTFFGRGQVYVKILPDGEPVQLTHDNRRKMSPAFSPDGTNIAYTTVDPEFHWDTLTVPVLGGEPQLLLKNASALVWTGPHQVLFSEIKMGEHMAIVAAEESRAGQRDLYVPADEQGMAHRSYLSPDGKWVLVIEMDQDHLWARCRLVPMEGRSPGRPVGPPGGGCTSGAWSPDGKWMYFTTNPVGANHIWRQRFPDGASEQVTSGPTEEEGIAMAPDGRSFVTAVALQNASFLVHDRSGERQVSLEGNATDPAFTPDGKKLLYRVVREAPNESAFYRDLGEVRVVSLESGRSEPLVQGLPALNYNLSTDGRQVVMETADDKGKPRVWLATLDRSTPPRQIPNVEGGRPQFGPDGEILFRHTEGKRGTQGTTGFIYRVRPDGTGMRKALEQPISVFWEASRDGRWVEDRTSLPGNGPSASQAFPLDGRSPVLIGPAGFGLGWSVDGGSVAIVSYTGEILAKGQTYIVPLPPGQMFPRIPAGGFRSEDQIARLPGARKIDVAGAVPGPSPEVYAFYRGTTQRNLYRIPIP
jgi:eukaryotic-like serine/threonine-protein kinase